MRGTSSVAQTSNVKTYDSCYLCEAGVSNPVLNGLQCDSQLVQNSTAAGCVSRKLCESSMVSEVAMGSNASHGQQCETSRVKAITQGDTTKKYSVTFVYNSNVAPKQVDALLARKVSNTHVKCQNVKSRTIWGSINSARVTSHNCQSKVDNGEKEVVRSKLKNSPTVEGCEEKVSPVAPTGEWRRRDQIQTAKVISPPHMSDHIKVDLDPESKNRVSVTTDIDKSADTGKALIYNVNGVDDKFASSIFHAAQFKKVGVGNFNVDTEIHKKWRAQSKFDFGYIPLDEQWMPQTMEINDWEGGSPW